MEPRANIGARLFGSKKGGGMKHNQTFRKAGVMPFVPLTAYRVRKCCEFKARMGCPSRSAEFGSFEENCPVYRGQQSWSFHSERQS